MGYHTNNKVYLVREGRFCPWVDFVRPFNRTVTLSELMIASAQLHKVTEE